MNVAQIIEKKRDGSELGEDEIRFLIEGYARQSVPDYQMAAFAMSVFFQGMTDAETELLTTCMIESGETMSWTGPPAVDKHSTGGIGDKVSIPLAPMLACCGVQVPMISGRGLGTTGGTLDKLESIQGFRCEMSNDEFRTIVNWNGCAIASASDTLAPADKRLYALRDVTATIPSIPLITSSILSKKVAEGIDALVLDVKWGSGAFMKSIADARKLAESLVRVGNRLGVNTSAVISDMNQPLGRMIGNAVEIEESLDILKDSGPEDVLQLTLELGSRLLVAAGVEKSHHDAVDALKQKIRTGEAFEKFIEMIRSQGGDLSAKRYISHPHTIEATESGFVNRINADRLGLAVIEMKGGRKKIEDELDHSTGIEFLVRLGDEVEAGQPIATVFMDGRKPEYVSQLVLAAVQIGQPRQTPPSLIVESVESTS